MRYKYAHIKKQNSVFVLDDMGDKLNKDIAYYFTEGRHYNIQGIVKCHKPAQIINTARMSCNTIYLTTYNGPDLIKILMRYINVNMTLVK